MGGDFCYTEQFEDDTANKTQECVKKDNKKKVFFIISFCNLRPDVFGLL